MGITEKMYREILALNVNVVTMGNHTWGKKEIFNFIDDKQIIRPANYSKNNPGRGYDIYECKGKKIGVINLIGRTSMTVLSENPFTVAKEIVAKLKGKVVINNIGTTIGSHTGPGTVALFFWGNKRTE